MARAIVCPGLVDCLVICCCNMVKKIFSDEEVFEQIKPKSRKTYEKCSLKTLGGGGRGEGEGHIGNQAYDTGD
jgi:hypothetical protein